MSGRVVAQKIAAVYQAFEGVPAPQSIDGCPCCTDERELTLLTSKARAELTSDDLASYAFSVMLTVGSADDFRFYLPRILDLAVTDPGWWVDIEVVYGALKRADWESWSEPEKCSILELTYEVLNELAGQDNGDFDEFDSWICAVARSGVSPIPYLENLLSPDRVDQLRQFHLLNANSLVKGKFTNSFWEREMSDPIVEWFNTPDVKRKLDDAYQAYYLDGD